MHTEKVLEVSCLEDFIQYVSLQKGTAFYSRTTNYMPIYRGQSNCDWPIEPAVYRNSRFDKECNYIRELERIEPDAFSSLTRIEKLIKMQHYGLPTRLIDFTYNSLVALYFACCSHPESDGVVFEVHAFPLYNQDFVWVSIVMKYLFEFSRLPFDPTYMIDELKRDSIHYPPRGVKSFYEINSITEILTTPLGLYPRFTNGRIKNQDGVFVIAGMNIKERNMDGIIFEKQSYTEIGQLWTESRTVIIPSTAKQEILRNLEKIGIHKRKLFPELDAQARFVTEYIDRLG